MKRVYVAGAFSADNVLQVLKNIGRGELACAKVFQAGFSPFCPWHDKSYQMSLPEVEFPTGMFYAHSMAWLDVSEAVLVLPGWENSKGTIREIEQAHKLNIPVFYTLEDLEAWDKE